MRTTISDVAKAAGVSRSTAARVLNGRAGVAPERRRRVEDAAHLLGYRAATPAPVARAQRTQTLGLLLPASLNPFYSEMTSAIVREAQRHGHAVIVDLFDVGKHDELRHLHLLRERRVDGALVGFETFAPGGREYLEGLQRGDFPLVALSAASASDLAVDRVAGDDEAAGYAITRHLLDLGHRRIAVVLDRPDLEFLTAYRVRGYQRALAEFGQNVAPEIIVTGATTPEAIGRVTRSLMKSQRPTAIFGCNDYTAILVQHTLFDAGLRVPQDVSVVGFDGITLGAHVSPPLTTMAYPWRIVARFAVRRLLELIDARAKGGAGASPAGCRQVLLPHDLVIRKSTGPPPQ